MNHCKTILYILVLLLLTSCAKEEMKHGVTSKDELYMYLDSLERCYESAYTKLELERWNKFTKEKSIDHFSDQTDFSIFFQDTSARNTIIEWRNRSNSLADKQLARRLELWFRAFLGYKIENNVDILLLENDIYNKFINEKISLGNQKISFAEAVSKIRDEKNIKHRKTIFQAIIGKTGDLEKDFLKLVVSRNNIAKNGGFHNYYSMLLYLQAIDESWLVKTLNFLEESTKGLYEKQLSIVKKRYRIKEFSPWDIEFAQKDIAAISSKYFPENSLLKTLNFFVDSIGFSKDSLKMKYVINSNVESTKGLIIKIPTDLRILIKQESGMKSYSESFMALGKILSAKFINVNYPILKGYNWIQGAYSPSYQKGIERLFGEFVCDSLWLKSFTNVKDKDIKQFIQRRSSTNVFWIRTLLKNFFTEYELYKNPQINLDSLERAMLKKYYLINLDDTTSRTFVLSQEFLVNPLSFHIMIVAEMISTQLQEALTSKFGDEKYSNHDVAHWLIEHLYSPGEAIEWCERIRNATGKNVEPGALLRKIGIEQSNLITNQNH